MTRSWGLHKRRAGVSKIYAHMLATCGGALETIYGSDVTITKRHFRAKATVVSGSTRNMTLKTMDGEFNDQITCNNQRQCHCAPGRLS